MALLSVYLLMRFVNSSTLAAGRGVEGGVARRGARLGRKFPLDDLASPGGRCLRGASAKRASVRRMPARQAKSSRREKPRDAPRCAACGDVRAAKMVPLE